MKKYKVGSLFAGVGGICQAFKNANCDVIWANEIDKNACKTYKLNHNETTQLINEDIRKLKLDKNMKSVDILTAGFPCQPFSQAGHGKGFEDERGKLFFEVTRLLKEIQPEAYFLENVRTLATHNNGMSFKTVKQEIANAGYSFIPFVLNAAEYTEIPHGRERIYIVGFKGEKEYSFDKPIKINTGKDKFDNYKSKLFNIPEKEKELPISFREYLDKETVKKEDYYSNYENKIHQSVIEAVTKSDTVYQYRRYYVRENKSKVCPTLTANMGCGGHNIPIILEGNKPRRLTPKECFNLQGFPKEFILPEDIARGQLYKQAGNTVVVPMVYKIAKEIVRVLNEYRIN